jgi:hypothetical protein
VTGRTVGGTELQPGGRRLDRIEALRLYTHGSAWFSGDQDHKGRLFEGAFADLAVLSHDYLAVPEEQIKHITSLLTIVNGKVVYADREFSGLAPPTLPATPDWTPFSTSLPYTPPLAAMTACSTHPHPHDPGVRAGADPFTGACFAF